MTHTPKGFLNAFRISKSVTELIERKGWKSGYDAGGAACPEFQRGVDVLIERELPNADSGTREVTLERDLAALERSIKNPLLPCMEEHFPEKSPDWLINELDARWPEGLWADEETGEVITVREIVARPELREKALELFHARANRLKQASRAANWELALFVNLRERIEGLPLPSEEEIRTFYGSGAWTAARTRTLDRDGVRCSECRTHQGPFEVDHIISLRECWHLRVVQSNLQVLCIPCHHRKHRLQEAAE